MIFENEFVLKKTSFNYIFSILKSFNIIENFGNEIQILNKTIILELNNLIKAS